MRDRPPSSSPSWRALTIFRCCRRHKTTATTTTITAATPAIAYIITLDEEDEPVVDEEEGGDVSTPPVAVVGVGDAPWMGAKDEAVVGVSVGGDVG
jgi:hypothetical protein